MWSCNSATSRGCSGAGESHLASHATPVMAALRRGHPRLASGRKAWMRGTSPRMTCRGCFRGVIPAERSSAREPESNQRLCGRRRRVHDRGLIEEFSHLRGHTRLAQFGKPQRMDACVLILIFDLGAAFLDAHIGAAAFGAGAAFIDDCVALGSKPDRNITRRPRARTKVLVEHAVGRRKAHAMAPVDTLKFVIAFVPQQRIARAMNEKDVQARSVPMPLLVGADR